MMPQGNTLLQGSLVNLPRGKEEGSSRRVSGHISRDAGRAGEEHGSLLMAQFSQPRHW